MNEQADRRRRNNARQFADEESEQSQAEDQAARLVIAVRDRFGGDAPSVYKAARIDRKTYSAIVSNELRPVSKRTAVAFAFALRLTREETDELIESAGYCFSMAILEDMVFTACLEAGIYDWDKVNAILAFHERQESTDDDLM